MAVSPQKSLAIAESFVERLGLVDRHADLYRRPRAASHLVSISASFAAMSWCSAICPIVSRVFAYFERIVRGTLGDPERLGRDPRPGAVEDPHGHPWKPSPSSPIRFGRSERGTP